MEVQAVTFKNQQLVLIDQRKLPNHYEHFICKNYKDVAFAIKDMVVRGAPAIGVAASYGAYLAALEFKDLPKDSFVEKTFEAIELLRGTRPTAVNLMWALDRQKEIAQRDLPNKKILELMMEEAHFVFQSDAETCMIMGEIGAELIDENDTILTHCNAGALATAKWGTALGVIRSAHHAGKNIFVYADETRPRLQGARLTAWELKEEGIPFKLIPDSVAATLIRDGKIDKIFVGADRIARNGDTANKIGTFMLSCIAKLYHVPFYIVAPVSTMDFSIASGNEIEIEERDIREVVEIEGVRIAPMDIEAYNPAFDVTPAENITGIVCEKGVLKPPFKEALARVREESK